MGLLLEWGSEHLKLSLYIYIYIYIYHVPPQAWISLTLFRHPSLSSIAPDRSSRLHPVSTQSWCIYVLASRPALACLCEGVHRSMLLMSSSQPFPVVSRIFGWSNVDSFRDGWQVAIQLLLCGVLPPGLVQYYSQHSCEIAVNLFLRTFS